MPWMRIASSSSSYSKMRTDMRHSGEIRYRISSWSEPFLRTPPPILLFAKLIWKRFEPDSILCSSKIFAWIISPSLSRIDFPVMRCLGQSRSKETLRSKLTFFFSIASKYARRNAIFCLRSPFV